MKLSLCYKKNETMKIGEILNSLLSNNINYQLDRIGYKINKISDLFKPYNELEEITFGPILLFCDKRPNSLISIAYAIKFATLFDQELYAITEGFHDEILKNECNKFNVKLKEIFNYNSNEISLIAQIVNEKEIKLAIAHLDSEWKEKILNNLEIPSLITKIDIFKS